MIKILCLFIALGLFLPLCSLEGDEPEIVFWEVMSVPGAGEPEQTDQGWTVEFSAFELAIRNLEFSIQGETHTRRWRWQDGWINAAFAHPGHYAGGEVTGELSGCFILRGVGEKSEVLGEAQLLVGDYNGLNFSFRKATVLDDGLPEASPLLSHTAFMEGTATRGDQSIPFQATVDIADNTEVIGVSLDAVVKTDTNAVLGIRILPKDKVENRHIFDGIDFASLTTDGDKGVVVQPGDEAHNRLMKALSKHDFYQVVVH